MPQDAAATAAALRLPPLRFAMHLLQQFALAVIAVVSIGRDQMSLRTRGEL